MSRIKFESIPASTNNSWKLAVNLLFVKGVLSLKSNKRGLDGTGGLVKSDP